MPHLPPPTAAELRRDPLPLRGRTALVTGASRRAGIGYAVARRLAAYGAGVYLHHHVPHDAAMPWGADRPAEVVAGVREARADPDALIADGPGDLADPDVPAELVRRATDALGGRLDILVANHALSGSDGSLGEIDAAMLDAHWAVNTRSVILLVKAYAAQHSAVPSGTPPGGGTPTQAVKHWGRVVMMTSGQDHGGGMPGELAYSLQKGALASVTRALARTLAPQAVTVNTVNPGPVDTDYASEDFYQRIAAMFPAGRWGMPDDPARLIAWLVTDEAAWITGQVIDSEGGFARAPLRGDGAS